MLESGPFRLNRVVATVQKATPIIIVILLACAPALVDVALSAPAAPDTLDYTVRPGDTLLSICEHHRGQTNHYALTDMLADIRSANGIMSNHLTIGQHVRIPVRGEEPLERVRDRVAAGAEMRGIYLAAPACAVSSVFTRVDRFIAAGGNAVVFDAKDIDGGVSFRSGHPLASWGAGRSAPLLPSLTDMMDRFDRRGLYVVARVALFLDGELGKGHPELALQDADGNPWAERGCVWVDPANPAVRDYNLTLAVELAEAGVDEIQFDYVRFPTNGWEGDWSGDQEATAHRRREVISNFLAAARDSLTSRGVRISADLYGIMAWDRVEDLALTGQHVPTIASLVDVVCPMIYPSHFQPGFEGRRHPGDDPGYFISEGTRRFVDLVDGQAEIRPWLQAFPFRVRQYDMDYIMTQVLAVRANGGAGWSLWNPSCRYNIAVAALDVMYGDEAGTVVAVAPALVAPMSQIAPMAPAPSRRSSSRRETPTAAASAGAFYGTLVRTPESDGQGPGR